MNKNLNTIYITVFSYLIIIILLSDFITKILLVQNVEYYGVSTVVKIVLLIFTVYFLIINKAWKHKLFNYLIAIILTFLLGQIVMLIRKGFIITDILNNAYTLITFMFMPLVAISFYTTPLSKEEIIYKNITLIKRFALLNVFFIIIGLICDFDLFKSYPFSSRFGYNGLLGSASASSYFYIMIIIIHYVDRFISKKKMKSLSLLILHVLISFLLGTKTVWFFLVLLSIFHFCIYIKNPFRYYFTSFLGLAIVLFFIYKRQIELFIVSLFSFGEWYYSNHGFITVITSTRDLFLKKMWTYYIENETITTVILGGVNVLNHRVEFELVNMFVFFGLLGTILYFILIKNLFEINFRDKILIKNALFVIVIITSALAGGFFYSVLSSILFYVSFTYINTIILHNKPRN